MNMIMSGLPGKVATAVTEVLVDEKYDVLKAGLTGPGMDRYVNIAGKDIELLPPEEHERLLENMRASITVDFTQPAVVNEMVEKYCKHDIPSIIGTTGGDRDKLVETVENSQTSAVIAPNMAIHIVAFQKGMNELSQVYAGKFRSSRLKIEESHQNYKVDTSGTAKAMVKYFNQMGIDYDVDDILKIRDTKEQLALGVSEKHLDGHGWHFYTVTGGPIDKLEDMFTELLNQPVFSNFIETDNGKKSRDGNIIFESYKDGDELTLAHKINGRRPYAEGVKHAYAFLQDNIVPGKAYTMLDVL